MSYPVVGTQEFKRKLADMLAVTKGKYSKSDVVAMYTKLCNDYHNPRKGGGKVRSSTSIDKRLMPKNCREMKRQVGTQGGGVFQNLRSNDPKLCWNPQGKRLAQ